jgi:hypothetical protein
MVGGAMDEFQIVCRDIKVERGISGLKSHIGTLGIKRRDGSTRILDHVEVANDINDGTARYYVEGGGRRAYVETFINEFGREWLRTIPDNTPLDNLRPGLPDCTPASGKVPPIDDTADGGGIDFEGGDGETGGGGGGDGD